MVEVWILSILYFNAGSILPKFDELQAVCLTLDPDIICITETWLSSNIEDQDIALLGYFSCCLDMVVVLLFFIRAHWVTSQYCLVQMTLSFQLFPF